MWNPFSEKWSLFFSHHFSRNFLLRFFIFHTAVKSFSPVKNIMLSTEYSVFHNLEGRQSAGSNDFPRQQWFPSDSKWCAEGDNQHLETFISDQEIELVTKSHFIMMVSIKNISQKSFLLLLMVFSSLILDTEAYNIHSYSKKCRVGLSEAHKACTVCKWYNISRESLPMRIQHVCFHLHKNQCCSQIKNQYLN